MGKEPVHEEQVQETDEGKKKVSLAKRILNVLHRLFLALFLTLFFIGLFLQFPFFQNWTVRQSARALERKLETRVEVGSFRLGWMSRLVLQDVLIYDYAQDTMLYSKTLRAQIDPNLITFLRKGLVIHEVSLLDTQLNLRVAEGEEESNLQQVLNRLFPPREKEKKGAFRVMLKRLFLERVELRSEDASRGSALHIFLDNGVARIDSMDLAQKKLRVRELILQGPVLRTVSREPLSAYQVRNAVHSTDTLRWDIGVESFQLSAGAFALRNYKKEPERLTPPGELNYQHLNVHDIDIQVQQFRYAQETFSGVIEKITLKEQEGFVLHSLSAKEATVNGTGITLNGVKLETPGTSLGDTLIFRYAHYSDFEEFPDKVWMDGRFNQSRVAIRDLVTFAPELLKAPFFVNNLEETVTLNARFTGRVNSLKGDNVRIEFDNGSLIDGNFSTRNLAIPNQQFLFLDINRLSTTARSIKSLVPDLNLPQNVDLLGRLRFKGRFTGFFYNFVAEGALDTELGSAKMDIQMKLTGGREKASYSGNLQLDNFDLGKWSGNPDLGQITMRSELEEGIGLSGETARAKLKADIKRFVFKGYHYENAHLEGNLQSNKFVGDFSIQDENIDLSFKGQVDVSQKDLPLYDFEVFINRLALKPLNLVKEGDIVLSGEADLDLIGKRLTDMTGEVRVFNFRAIRDGHIFQLDSAYFKTTFDALAQKNFTLRSEAVNASLYGLFDLERVPGIFVQHLTYYFPGFSSKLGIQSKDSIDQLAHFDFYVDIVNSKGFETLLDPRLGSLSGLAIAGRYDGRTGLLRAEAETKSWLQFDEVYLENVAFRLDLNRSTGNLDFGAKRILVNNKQEFFNLSLLTNLEGDTLEYALNYAGQGDAQKPGVSDKIFVDGKLFVLDSNFLQHQLIQNEITLLGTTWKINANNTITFNKESLSIKDFVLFKDNRAVALESKGARGLELAFLNFELEELNDLIHFEPIKFDGLVQASVSVDDVFELSGITFSAVSDSVFLNGDDWGVMRVNAKMNNPKDAIQVYVSLTRDTAQLVAEGFYNLADLGSLPIQEKGYFQLELTINSYPLSIAEYFIGETVSQIQGSFDAALLFNGQFSQPNTQGEVIIKGASLQIDYLKTRYGIERAVVKVNNTLFNASGAVLTDRMRNIALLQGGIRHRYLKDFGFDARLFTERFLAMDTRKGDNKLFYGQGMASGSVVFSGSFDQPNIYVNAQAIDGTRVAIPISSERDAGQLKFFRFVEKDTSQKTAANRVSAADLKGVNFEMDLVINEAALMQIIFNEQAGDIIEGSGRGALRILVPRNGDFRMFGDVTIERGEYLFTMYNVINKDFNIRRGGSITWSGDPYRAIINLEAEYKGLFTSVSTFIQEFLINAGDNVKSEASQSTVVNLLLKLQGELLSPSITFDLAFPNLQGELLSYTENKLRLLRQDPNEMNKQVFGLIVAGQFLPADFSFQGSQIIYNTVSEFLSNQLSLMITQLFSELLGGETLSSVNFDIAYNQYQNANLGQSGGLNRGNELQVSLRQNYFDDRLSILVGGNIDLGNNWRNATGATGAFIGNDLVIEYQLVKDRSVKLRIYQKLLPDISGRILRVGSGLSFRKEFNTFGEFVRSFREEGNKMKKSE